MTVNPGFGGQACLETMEPKIAEARHLIAGPGLPTSIEVDRGISAATAPRAMKAGAELLVAGSAILAHPEGKSAAVGEQRRSLQPDVAAPAERRAVHYRDGGAGCQAHHEGRPRTRLAPLATVPARPGGTHHYPKDW
jgi:Ribulose-phosphate 3 epimerase family